MLSVSRARYVLEHARIIINGMARRKVTWTSDGPFGRCLTSLKTKVLGRCGSDATGDLCVCVYLVYESHAKHTLMSGGNEELGR